MRTCVETMTVARKPRTLRALLVGGNPVRLAALEFELAKAGFEVTRAADGQQAFEIAAKRRFDLLITEFQTARGSGVDLARQLRYLGTYDATPMVLLAGCDADLDLEFLRESLWLLVIREPYAAAILVNRLARHFQKV